MPERLDWWCVPSRLRAAPRGVAPHKTHTPHDTERGAARGDAVTGSNVERLGSGMVSASRAAVRRASIGVWSHLRSGMGGSSDQDQAYQGRTSSISDKRSTASVTAMRVAEATNEIDELRNRVQVSSTVPRAGGRSVMSGFYTPLLTTEGRSSCAAHEIQCPPPTPFSI